MARLSLLVSMIVSLVFSSLLAGAPVANQSGPSTAPTAYGNYTQAPANVPSASSTDTPAASDSRSKAWLPWVLGIGLVVVVAIVVVVARSYGHGSSGNGSGSGSGGGGGGGY